MQGVGANPPPEIFPPIHLLEDRSSHKYLRNANKKINTLPSKLGMHFDAGVNNYLSTQAMAYVAGTLAK